MLASLGLILVREGELDAAHEELIRALALTRSAEGAYEPVALGGLASIAFANQDYQLSTELYRQALRASRGDDARHRCEDLAGLTESLAAEGKTSEMKRAAQKLVTEAQASHLDLFASQAFGRTARWFQGRRIRTAAQLYSAFIGLAYTGMRGRHDAPEAWRTSILAQA